MFNDKIKEALKTRWGNQLGIKDDAVFEGVAASVEPLITSDEQLTQFVEGAKSMLTQPQSYADKVRTELNAKIKGLEGEKAELEAKLNGNQPNPNHEPPKPADDEKVPAWAQVLIDSNKALSESNKALSEKLAGFEATKAKEAAIAALDKFVNEWDYAKGFPKEAAEAKRIAMKLYAKGGENMTAEELIAEFRGEFDPAVKTKGVTDFTKPFESDGGGDSDSLDMSDWDKTMENMGWNTPKEN